RIGVSIPQHQNNHHRNQKNSSKQAASDKKLFHMLKLKVNKLLRLTPKQENHHGYDIKHSILGNQIPICEHLLDSIFIMPSVPFNQNKEENQQDRSQAVPDSREPRDCQR